ncbi:nucleoside triphosphate pyrophosphohydrolase family protein [Sinorhizobium meliloti]|uniref:nucleoside triphosphate pyrophosphohydrolase family protein n=1 Tax=Rhizobium meliloti TaxID=382 RepID=UPI001F312A6C|nr:nucleoside triphosphate pyrophosphohydrolase family protein [Sinorhizobium meliloti]
MDFRTYQVEALRTDVSAAAGKDGRDALIVPMLGLAGEAGQLLSEYKKHLRDGDAHKLFKERVCEELGDLLWYLANVASKFDLNLDDVARSNLAKAQERWDTANNPLHFWAPLKNPFEPVCVIQSGLGFCRERMMRGQPGFWNLDERVCG